MQIDWFDLNESTDNSGWLSNEPDREEQTQPKPEEKEVRIVVVAGMAKDKGKLPKNTGIKNLAQQLGTVSTVDTEQEATLKWFEKERDQNKQEAGIGQHPAGNTCNERMIKPELDNCLSIAEGVWWKDDDLHLAHINEDWKESLPDNTWYSKEVDHMTRSGRYFKPPHLDQAEASRKDKEAEKQKEKQLEEEAVPKQLKKIQADISIWGLLMASRVHRQAILSAMDKSKLSINQLLNSL